MILSWWSEYYSISNNLIKLVNPLSESHQPMDLWRRQTRQSQRHRRYENGQIWSTMIDDVRKQFTLMPAFEWKKKTFKMAPKRKSFSLVLAFILCSTKLTSGQKLNHGIVQGKNVKLCSRYHKQIWEIKHSDWMFQVTWLLLTNQSALFQSSILYYNKISL